MCQGASGAGYLREETRRGATGAPAGGTFAVGCCPACQPTLARIQSLHNTAQYSTACNSNALTIMGERAQKR